MHTCLGHSNSERGINAYTQKENYLKNFIYTSLRYAAGDFIGCMDSTYAEYHADYTKNDQAACKNLISVKVAFETDARNSSLPLVSQDQAGTLLHVEFFKRGPNTVTITDVSGKQVYHKADFGQARYALPTPRKSGIYVVKAMAGGKVTLHRVTVL